MLNIFLAIGLPVVLMFGVTRIVHSVIGAIVVTMMVMFFVLQIHQMSGVAITLAIISFLAGLRVAIQMRKKIPD